jgi:hypothetical protein
MNEGQVVCRASGIGGEQVACVIYESSLRADTGGENPYIDTKDVLKLLIVGDSAVRLLVPLGARSVW